MWNLFDLKCHRYCDYEGSSGIYDTTFGCILVNPSSEKYLNQASLDMNSQTHEYRHRERERNIHSNIFHILTHSIREYPFTFHGHTHTHHLNFNQLLQHWTLRHFCRITLPLFTEHISSLSIPLFTRTTYIHHIIIIKMKMGKKHGNTIIN